MRPSGARLRESLFSCLISSGAPGTPGTPGGHGGGLAGLHCLDLFAGSGALGLTAASHGAASVTLVERNRRTAAALAEQITQLQARAVVRAMPAARFLAAYPAAAPKFNLVFLDPPFADYATDAAWARLLAAVAPHLSTAGAAGAGGRVYAEHQRLFAAPAGWRRLTARKVGDVHWQLLQAPSQASAPSVA